MCISVAHRIRVLVCLIAFDWSTVTGVLANPHDYPQFARLVLALLVAGPQHLAALGGIDGTFEYAIDVPWRGRQLHPAAGSLPDQRVACLTLAYTPGRSHTG